MKKKSNTVDVYTCCAGIHQLFNVERTKCVKMKGQRIKFYLLICYFIKWNAVYSAEENQFPKGHQKQLGSHRAPEGKAEELLQMPTPSLFYNNYVAKSKPVIFKGAAKESDAFKLWTDNYLRCVVVSSTCHESCQWKLSKQINNGA
jgi:hypothetical protein